MAKDIRDKLRRQLGGAIPKALPGQGPRQLEDKGQRPASEEKAPMYMPVDVYLMTDGTSSMEPVIAAVRKGLGEIATELLQQPDRGDIKISTGVVRDHFCPPSEVDLLQALYFDTRPTLQPMQSTDYLQIHDLRHYRKIK